MELGAALLRSRQGSDPGCQGSPSCEAPPLPPSGRTAARGPQPGRRTRRYRLVAGRSPPAAAAGPGQRLPAVTRGRGGAAWGLSVLLNPTFFPGL